MSFPPLCNKHVPQFCLSEFVFGLSASYLLLRAAGRDAEEDDEAEAPSGPADSDGSNLESEPAERDASPIAAPEEHESAPPEGSAAGGTEAAPPSVVDSTALNALLEDALSGLLQVPMGGDDNDDPQGEDGSTGDDAGAGIRHCCSSHAAGVCLGGWGSNGVCHQMHSRGGGRSSEKWSMMSATGGCKEVVKAVSAQAADCNLPHVVASLDVQSCSLSDQLSGL